MPGIEVDAAAGDRASVQRRVVRTLVLSQALGGLGMASGLAVGALLAQDVSGTESLAGLGTTFQVLGAALIAIPVARVMAARGRRPGLALGLVLALVGATLVVTAAVARSFALLLLGMLLFGGGTSANSQARYAAADLADPGRRGRDLSVVVWATTIGSVLGPNLVGPGQALARAVGLPPLAGSFGFSLVGFVLALLVVTAFLRPDPLLLARALEREARRAGAARPAGAAQRVASGASGASGAALPAADGAARAVSIPAGSAPDGTARAVSIPVGSAPDGAAPLEPVDGLGPGELGDGAEDHDGSLTRGLRVVRSRAGARLGVLTIALGHVVMVSVMVMTPVHMRHGHAELEVIGLVISAHVLGMFAFSPLVGAAVDRWGSRPVAAGGGAVLTVAALLAGRSAAGWSPLLLVALLLLGVGWSGTLISGSTLLIAAVSPVERPATQGLSEVLMGLAGAAGGAVAGVVVDRFGYSALASTASVVGLAIVALQLTSRTGAPRR
ncbi:MAG TPA: MFS transporter [Intrasporangium sp.]|uniref:MFS transporter n=1 Tax=Intrasporangium sp. TaxID=1925024 RepID=UPI002D785CDC|nr:MFS transporter [Intrasporangium sp.]HET7399777.1 MFS transporter [Intrasporangium sp.]